MEGEGRNATPCRLSEAAEEADCTTTRMKEFITCKTNKPIIYLVYDNTEAELVVILKLLLHAEQSAFFKSSTKKKNNSGLPRSFSQSHRRVS